MDKHLFLATPLLPPELMLSCGDLEEPLISRANPTTTVLLATPESVSTAGGLHDSHFLH